MKQFPCDLERDERLARAGGQCEENAHDAGGDGLHHLLDGDVLVVAAGMRTAFVLERHGGEAVAPLVRLGKSHGPEFIRRGVGGDFTFLARLHVDGVDAMAIGGVGEAHCHLAGIILGLRHAFRQRLVPRLGFVHGQLVVAIDQHVIGC